MKGHGTVEPMYNSVQYGGFLMHGGIIYKTESMMEGYKTQTIYSDNNPNGARSIWITLYNGILYMNSQDVSPKLESIFGRDTFERFVSGINSDDLKDFLKVKTDNELIATIKELFGKDSGIDDFQSFLKENGITFKYGSY